MSKLFAPDESWTDDGLLLTKEAQAALKPILEKWHKAGFKMHDIVAVMQQCLWHESTFVQAMARFDELDNSAKKD